MSTLDLDMQKQKLHERREELLADVESSAEASQTVELDQSRVGRLSRMDAMQSQAMSQALKLRREVELQKITAAFARMDSGDYGLCLACDEEISIGRLEFDPATPYCVICAEGK